MRKVRYVGPYEAIEVPAAGIEVARLEWIEVSAGLAKELLKSDDWAQDDRPNKDEESK